MVKTNAEHPKDNSPTETPAQGFTPGKIKRLIAVALFLGGGTFAVSQFVSYEKKPTNTTVVATGDETPVKNPAEITGTLKQNDAGKSTQSDQKKQPLKENLKTSNAFGGPPNKTPRKPEAKSPSSFQPQSQIQTLGLKGPKKSNAQKSNALKDNSFGATKKPTGSKAFGNMPAKPSSNQSAQSKNKSNGLAGLAPPPKAGPTNGFDVPANPKLNPSSNSKTTAKSDLIAGNKSLAAKTAATAAEVNNNLRKTENSPNNFGESSAFSKPKLAPTSAPTPAGLRPASPGEAANTNQPAGRARQSSNTPARPNLLKTPVPNSTPRRGLENASPNPPRNPAAQTAFDKSKGLPPAALPATKPPLGVTPTGTTGFEKPVAPKTVPNKPNQPLSKGLPNTLQPPRGRTQPSNLQTVAGSNRTTPTGLPAMRSPAMRSPVMQNASSRSITAVGFTRSTPGDRQYEGVQAPSVTIEKVAPREIQVNTPADFQLVVKNVGRITANQVEVHDQIPAGTELMQAMPQPLRGDQGQVSWKLGSLKPGQEKRIDVRLKPTKPGEIGSVAHVTFAAQASMRTRVTQPILSIAHRIQPKVLIGGKVTLEIAVKNEGNGPATNVYIQEDVPPQLSFDGGIRELEYPLGTLAPGQSKSVRLSLNAAQAGQFKNTIVAFADGGLQSQHSADIEVVAPNLTAATDGPRKRYLRREATHELAVQNTGTARATNVEMVARLPDGLKFMSANNRGKYDRNTHAVYWSMAELGAGLVANVSVKTLPMEPGQQNIRFETVADLNQSARIEHSLNVEHLTDIFFEIDDVVDPIEVGSDTTYRVRIVNQGTKTATNVQLLVDLPAGITPTSVEGSITSEIRNQEILFAPIMSLNPGDEVSLRINAKGVSPGDHRIAVNLQSDGREINVTKQESTRVYSDR